MTWTSPRTWVAGEDVDETMMNTHVRDNLLELNGTASAWTAYVPTLTNLTLGNGTLEGRYKQIGKTVHFTVTFVHGSTSAMGTGAGISLPVTATANARSLVNGFAYDVSANTGVWVGGAPSTTAIGPYVTNGGTLAAGSPFTWATGDSLTISGTYEAA